MIKVAIVEDEFEAQERLKKCLAIFSDKENVDFDIRVYPNGSSFIESFRCQFDIVYLDIEMPGINGMDTAKIIRKKDKEVILVFVTNLAQMALEGYQVEALDFIVKPIDSASFCMKMQRVLSRSLAQAGKSISVINMEGEIIIIRHRDIYYVETDGHYVIYHLTSSDMKIYGTLKQVEEKIDDGKTFVRCNRSFLVNLQYLEKIEKDNVIIHGVPLIISRPSRKEFLASVARYLGG